jgi:serine/threonine-protein phosphatase 2A activator
MAQTSSDEARFRLQRLQDNKHSFATPTKRINDGDDLNFFLSSTAYRDLTLWLLQLNRSMFPARNGNRQVAECSLQSPPPFPDAVNKLRLILDGLLGLLDRAPPSTGLRRFGNVAFRDWHRLADQEAAGLITTHLSPNLSSAVGQQSANDPALISELRAYLLGSFGSAQRLDYGTGHELSFLAFLGCLWKLGLFSAGDERAIVIGVIQPYLELVRKLILTYTLEPAGSHGVWGLDDHSFIPYIFGSAQLGPAIDPQDYSRPIPTEGSLPSAPDPSGVTKQAEVSRYKDDNMYFSAIQFIHDVKKGPFWEHSPVLYDISGIKDGWGKINKGMLKMYAAEVLGKFPVVQHFPFGTLFAWESDPEAGRVAGSVHAQQQPAAKSMDVPAPAASVGTSAPWAKKTVGTMPQMQASTGMPTTRAPWASVAAGRAPQIGGMPPAERAPQAGGVPPTAAPWARKDQAR